MKNHFRFRSLISAVLTVLLTVALTVSASAGRVVDLMAEETYNKGYQNYYTWSSTIASYLTPEEEDAWQRVEYNGTAVVIETYDSDLKLTAKKTIEPELPLWGGYYAGEDYNYLVFGQTNPEEDNEKEILRVVRYTKDWERVDQASVLGADTVIPFDAGTLRMTESEDYLYIHTSHEMYTSADGLNHQSNMSYRIKKADMGTDKAVLTDDNDNYGSYTSHSFNQFVIRDGKNIVKLDHGDAYPRAFVLSKKADSEGASWSGTTRVTLMTFGGEKNYDHSVYNYNITGASAGGLEASSGYYLAAGNSIDQSKYDSKNMSNLARNIFVAAVPKDDLTSENVQIYWITKIADGSGVTVSTPQLVKISGEKMLLMWTEKDGDTSESLKYVFLDESGKPSGEIYTSAQGALSECQPVVRDGKVTWYMTENSAANFYAIDLEHPETVQELLIHGWREENGKTVFYDNAGEKASGWTVINSGSTWTPVTQTFYFDEGGIAHTGWLRMDGKSWYFNENGVMQTGLLTIGETDQYYFDEESGEMQTGWVTYTYRTYNWEKEEYENRERLCWFDQDGKRKTGLIQDGDKTYYLDTYTGLAHGFIEVAGDDPYSRDGYYFDEESGEMQTGWVTITRTKDIYNRTSGEWEEVQETYPAYFATSGKMVREDWLEEKNGKYYMNEDGKKITGFAYIGEDAYFFDEEGVMQTGWRTISWEYETYNWDTEKYETVKQEYEAYFHEDGVMAASEWLVDEKRGEKYYVFQNGKKAVGRQWIDGERYLFLEDGCLFVRQAGDANLDKEVDGRDAIRAAKLLKQDTTNLTPSEMAARENADMNGDERLNEKDLQAIMDELVNR